MPGDVSRAEDGAAADDASSGPRDARPRDARLPGAGPRGDREFADLVYVPGVEHVARIAEGVYRGAQPDGVSGYRALAEAGIRTVVSLRQYHDRREDAEAAGLEYVALPVQAGVLGSEPPSDEQIEAFFGLVLDPARHPLYFHCMTGKDRTGTMCALYRIEVDGWSNDEAERELLAFGYHEVYRDLVRFVRAYRPRGFTGPDRPGRGGGFPPARP